MVIPDMAFHSPCICFFSNSYYTHTLYLQTLWCCTVVSKTCCYREHLKLGPVSGNPLLSGDPLPYLICAPHCSVTWVHTIYLQTILSSKIAAHVQCWIKHCRCPVYNAWTLDFGRTWCNYTACSCPIHCLLQLGFIMCMHSSFSCWIHTLML